MKDELDDKLVEKYPKIFRDRHADMMTTALCWGLEIGDGWYWLIDNLCSTIQSYTDNNSKRKRIKNKCARFFIELLWKINRKLKYRSFLREKIFNYKYIQKIEDKFEKEEYETISQVIATQVKEKFGCYDKETEVLTKDGWKFFKDVDNNDYFATLENDYLVYYKSSDIISYHYKGKMYELNARGVNLMVTPNHNLYVAKGNYYNGRYKPPIKKKYNFEFATPDKYFRTKKRFLKSVKWIGIHLDKYKIDDYQYSSIGSNYYKLNFNRNYTIKGSEHDIVTFLKFLGFYTAEGCCDPNGGEISISFCNTDNGIEKKIISDLIVKLGYKLKHTMLENSAGVCKIYNKGLAIWLHNNIGHLAHNKKVPSFIKELTPKLIENYLDYLYIGDGHKAPTSHTLTTTSKKLSEDVEELIIKSGYSFYTYIREIRISNKLIDNRKIISKHKSYEINWLKKSNDFNIETKIPKQTKSYIEKWTDYDDMVYCVTVPNNLLFVKRKGKAVWCGNSLRFYYDGGDEKIDGMVWLAEHMSYYICEDCGSTKNIGQTKGWITTLCEDCSKNNPRNWEKYKE